METRKDKVDRLRKEIESSPGWKIHQQRKAIEISFLIYEGNFQDVCAVLAYMGNFSNAVKVLAQGNETQRQKVDLDLRRKLFNCLSSAFALIDHTRKFIKGYSSNPDFVAEYQKRVDKNFAKSELHRFFQDYRNYVHHYAIPLLTHTLQFGRDIGESYTCGMQKKDLLRWNQWSKLAKSWIDKQPDNIPIEENIKAHHQEIANFYTWFLSQILHIHGQDIEKANELIRQCNAALMGT